MKPCSWASDLGNDRAFRHTLVASQHDLSGKTLVPFIARGGYGLGNSLAVIAEHAPGARLIDGFSKQCDQERETLREVTRWLASVEIGR